MGNISQKNIEIKPPPRYHFKCRYDKDDEHCIKNYHYTRTTDVSRAPVPRECIKWNVALKEYYPISFTSSKVIDYQGKIGYRDPNLDHQDYSTINFNHYDKVFNCDRKSHHGPYKFMQFDVDVPVLVPCNPVGRTGIIGRGHLGRWGPNHAADSIVTRWKRDDEGNIIYDEDDGKPILQFVSIKRRDTKQWAIPGGMIDPGEIVTKTLVREFAEEALSQDLVFNDENKVESRSKYESVIKDFFTNGNLIYKGYVDDPRNTDNAWMETVVYNFHDETSEFVGKLNLKGGDDAEKAKWIDLTDAISLFASHTDFIRSVAKLRGSSRKNL